MFNMEERSPLRSSRLTSVVSVCFPFPPASASASSSVFALALANTLSYVGLRCRTDLKRGQFIDKYLGELITDAEADRRESAAGPGRDSYMFWLDKHMVDQEEYGLHQEDCFVADGKAMGGPTRFINHSCDPNVRMFTVSYNKYDERIYDLAFFAIDDIPKGTELTFDYMDADPDEDEDVAAQNKEKKVKEMEQSGKKSVRCLCGAENCRGSMWVKPEEPTV